MSATAEHYAKEAERLLNDETLASAFETVKLTAMLALCAAEATDTKEIQRLQAIANCLQEVRDELHAAITATGRNDGGMSLTPPSSAR
jgi:hypothetical protein